MILLIYRTLKKSDTNELIYKTENEFMVTTGIGGGGNRGRIVREGFSAGSHSKESAYSGRDQGSIPGWGRHPEGENGNPLQYPYLENPMDRGA